MKFIAAFILLLLSSAAWAQYNDSVHYYIGATSTGSINKTDEAGSYLLNNRLKLGVRKKLYSINLSNSWVYGAQETAPVNKPTLTNNDYNSTMYLNFFDSLSRFFCWGLGNYVSSFSLRVNNQYQAGAGVTYRLIDHKSLQLSVSDGILYDHNDIYLPDSVRDVYSTYRNSFRLVFRWTIKDRFALNGTGFYQNSFSSSTDYVIKGTLSLDIKINKWLHFTAMYNYNRFNQTREENTLFTYGFTVDRFF